MYERDTILTLKEQREPDSETGEVFAYNEVRVVGPSPVSHAAKGDWRGPDAAGVVIVPISNFGGTLDEPYGKLREMYDVKELPEFEPKPRLEQQIVRAPKVVVPTPEEVFASEAPGVAPEEGQIRGRTNPLGEPGGPAEKDGPLGKSPTQRRRKPANGS